MLLSFFFFFLFECKCSLRGAKGTSFGAHSGSISLECTFESRFHDSFATFPQFPLLENVTQNIFRLLELILTRENKGVFAKVFTYWMGSFRVFRTRSDFRRSPFESFGNKTLKKSEETLREEISMPESAFSVKILNTFQELIAYFFEDFEDKLHRLKILKL